MYFNNKNSDTDINKEFKNNKSDEIKISLPKINLNKFVIIGVVIVLLIVLLVLFMNKKKNVYYLELLGKEEMSLYQGTDYIEPGYKAYNSKKADLSSFVEIKKDDKDSDKTE